MPAPRIKVLSNRADLAPTRSGSSSSRRSRGGVCDYTKPGVGQDDTVPWLTYQPRRGRVIYGGKPTGRRPVSRRIR